MEIDERKIKLVNGYIKEYLKAKYGNGEKSLENVLRKIEKEEAEKLNGEYINEERLDGLQSIERIHCEEVGDLKFIFFIGDGKWCKLLYTPQIYNHLICKAANLLPQNSDELKKAAGK